MDVEIKKLNPQNTFEFAELIKIFGIVFETEDLKIPEPKYLENLLSNPDFFVIIVEFEGKVVGGLTVYVLHSYYSAKPVAYIYDVGVLPNHQRKGIGKSLIKYLTQFCKENDFENAYVEAEADDLQAVNFYRKTQFSSELQATHFTYYFDK